MTAQNREQCKRTSHSRPGSLFCNSCDSGYHRTGNISNGYSCPGIPRHTLQQRLSHTKAKCDDVSNLAQRGTIFEHTEIK